MSNVITYKDSMAFHPGYYIQEIIEDSGITQEDFAKRLGTTPKNLSLLIRGKQSLSAEMASKLSRLLGTSFSYWMNIQNKYDATLAEIETDKELQEEKKVLADLGYGYFRDNFHLPDLPRKTSEQVVQVRHFLKVSSLTTLRNGNLAVSFRSTPKTASQKNVIRANALVQIAVNRALEIDAPPYDKKAFTEATAYALTQTQNHSNFYPLLRERFLKAGVIFVVLPNLPGSGVNGATKKIGSSIMLMVNDRQSYSDSFWFTLFHEIGHIMKGDFGTSFENEKGVKEAAADRYAEDSLVPPPAYYDFVTRYRGHFTRSSICSFAHKINRDPAIVLGRLQNDNYVGYGNSDLESLRHRYKVLAK